MAVELVLGRSRRLALLLWTMHLSAVALVLLAPNWPLPTRVLLAVILVCQLKFALRRFAYRCAKDATIRIVCDNNGYLRTINSQNDTENWRMTAGGFAVRGLIILHLIGSRERRKTLVISSDATSAEGFASLLARRRLA